AIGSSRGSGTPGGTTSHAAANGLATFPGISINNAGSGYTLVASAAGLTSATSPAFDISVGSATKLGFFLQTSATAGGTAISPAVRGEIQDIGGNPRAGATENGTPASGQHPNPRAISRAQTTAAAH